MSYISWHNYGYGICVTDIQNENVERLQAMLKLAPELDREIHAWFASCFITEPTWEDYEEFDQDYMLGLATILRRTIEEVEGISLTACDDLECRTYLIYQPQYPWQITEKERDLTEERLRELFQRYVGLLTDEIIDIDYQSAENGG